ncbi:MAG: tRNA (guanosine(46)-N7)-methyltransferase TrmB, partial [Acholeplasmataceae bacterium]
MVKSSPLIAKAPITQTNIYLELGSGKGNFIYALAQANPENHYVAVERQSDIIYRILQKQEAQTLTNLTLLNIDVDEIEKYIKPHSVNTLYINFPDPWYKPRHHKRRLTYPTYLKIYKTLLKPCGKILFRTDHKDLFQDSIEYLNSESFHVSYDMNASPIFN